MFRYRQINNQPTLLRGGIAIPIRPGVKLLKGRTHATGGIDDGRVEAENNEVVAETPNAVIYGSAHNILDLHSNGQITPAKKKMGGNISPAKLMIAGVNPKVVNDVQQAYKDRFNLNDDGTKKTGGNKKTKAELGLKNIINKAYAAISPIGYLSNKYILPHIMNWGLQRTAGIGDATAIFPIILSSIDKNKYDGKLHIDNYTENLDFTNTIEDNNRNLIRLYTLQDSTGFEPSTIGPGRYTNTKFGKLNAYKGKFYGDTTYLPIKYYDKIQNINDSVVYLNKDNVRAYPNPYNLDNTDDVAHHTTTLKRNGKKYIARHEDVFDTNSILDYFNHPFIINQDTPIYFTRDKEKLSRYPYLTKALSEFIDKHQKDNTKMKFGGRLTIVPFTGKIKESKTTDTTIAKLGTKKADLGTVEPNLTKEDIIIGNDGTPYYRDKRTGMIHKVGDTAFINGKLSKIGDLNNNNNNNIELNDRRVESTFTNKPQTIVSEDNMFNNVTFPVANFRIDGDIPWLNRIPSTSTLSTKPTVISTITTSATTPAKSTPIVTSSTTPALSTLRRTTPAVTPTKDITLDFGDTPVIDRSTPTEIIRKRSNRLARRRINPTHVVEIPETIDGMEIAKPKIDVNPTTTTPDIKVDIPVTRQPNLWEKLKLDFKVNPGDYIGAGANLLGNIGSWLTNNYAINKMVAPSAPMPKLAAKLKTRININPQLDKMRETIAMMDRNIRQNTISSAVVMNRISRLRAGALADINRLYGQKENQETELINRDKLNQQTVANANVDTYNQYQDKLTDFYNKKRELKSENANALIQGLNTTVQNALTRRDKRRQYNLSLETIRRAYPEETKYLIKNLI